VGDKGFDSDSLDEKLVEDYGIELIAPHKDNRVKKATQDGRPFRRYRRRWQVERMFAWIKNFRRLTTRYEVKAENFLAMVKLGALMILIKNYL
jgi:transposase